MLQFGSLHRAHAATDPLSSYCPHWRIGMQINKSKGLQLGTLVNSLCTASICSEGPWRRRQRNAGLICRVSMRTGRETFGLDWPRDRLIASLCGPVFSLPSCQSALPSQHFSLFTNYALQVIVKQRALHSKRHRHSWSFPKHPLSEEKEGVPQPKEQSSEHKEER